jgi:hypothetical protein
VGEGDEQQYQQKSGSVAQVSIASRPYKLHLFSSGGKEIPQKHTHARTNWRCSFFKRLGYYVHLNASDVRMKEINERLAMKILRLVPRKTKLLAPKHYKGLRLLGTQSHG